MADKTISGIVTWLKGWFYDKDEITTKENALQTQINNKASQSDLNTLSSTVNDKLDASAYVVDSALSSSSENPVQNKVVNTGLSNKVDKVSGKSLSTNDFTTAYKTQLDNLSTNLASKTVTVEKLATAETGFLASYVVKQNGVQVGNTINIPKDFLLKSGTIETVTVADQPVTGYVVGDKYLDLVINTKTSDGTDEHIYVLVSDLVSSSVDWSDIQNKPSSFTPASHNHGNITNDGKMTTSVTVASGDYLIISDASDSNILKKVANVLATHIKDSTAHNNIGSSASATQSTINTNIDTALGTINTNVAAKANKSQVIDWDSLTFVAKATDSTGAITFDYLE